MDRTVALNSDWRFFYGLRKPSVFGEFRGVAASLPVESDKIVFTLTKRIVCPKQVNDTVTVYFDGSFKRIELLAGKKPLEGVLDENGKYVFDITSALKTGKTLLTAHVFGGSADGFYLSVKRNYGNK